MIDDLLSERGVSLVSVVVVNFNGKEHLEACLSSLENLNFPREHLEVIMVDNASRDGSVKFVSSRFPRVKTVRNSNNVGFARAVNIGVEQARGDYVALLNNDAKADSEWLTQLLLPVLSQSDVVCSSSKILTWDGKNIDFVGGTLGFYGHGFKVKVGSPAVSEEGEKPILFPCGGAMLVDKKVFLDVGGFDEDYFAFFEDVDFGWRLWVLGYRVFFAPKSLVYHHHHATTSKVGYERERFLLERNALYTVVKNYDEERFQRIFPVAALLALGRGMLDSDLDVRSYRIGDELTSHPEETERITRMTACHLLAVQECLKNLPKLMEKRRAIQKKRKRSDSAILCLFGDPFRPNIQTEDYIKIQSSLVDALNLGELFAKKSRVLIISNDTIGERMAGPAIRCWEFANVLSREHDVILAAPNEAELNPDNFVVRQYNRRVLKELVKWCDVFVCQGFVLHHFPFLKNAGKPIVVDIYDPFTLEMLELFKYKDFQEREALNEANLKVLNDQLMVGDFFICASEKQRDYWIGMLCSLNRINPRTYDRDKTLRKFIDVVPFGLPSVKPYHTRAVLKGVHPNIGVDDRLILWGGGIYNWFDPITLIKAMGEIVRERRDVKLYFMGLKHPNPDVPEMKMCLDAIELSEELGLKDEFVFFNYDWVPYEERKNYLLEADIGISTHLEHVETSYSFRTRILDYLWAGLPMISTKGDSMSDLIEKYELGRTVEPEGVEELKEAILELVEDKGLCQRIKENIERVVPQFTWEKVATPLIEFCRNPILAPDKKTEGGPLKSREGAVQDGLPRRSLWYYLKRLWFHFRKEGVGGVIFHGRNLAYRMLRGR